MALTLHELSVGLCLLALGCEARQVGIEAPAARELAREGAVATGPEPALVRTQFAPPSIELDLPLPTATARERCPDELLPLAWEADASLRVRVRDARANRREILPLDLKLALDTENSPESESETEVEPGNRYLAELVIEDYAGPRLFRRLNAPRSEWAPGKLSARIVVHDRRAQRVLCHAPVQVRGDASSASIRRRLRESTRRALEKKLHEQTWREISLSLGQISSVFRAEPRPATVNSG